MMEKTNNQPKSAFMIILYGGIALFAVLSLIKYISRQICISKFEDIISEEYFEDDPLEIGVYNYVDDQLHYGDTLEQVNQVFDIFRVVEIEQLAETQVSVIVKECLLESNWVYFIIYYNNNGEFLGLVLDHYDMGL